MIGAFILVIFAFSLAVLLPIKAQIPFFYSIVARLIIIFGNVVTNGQFPGAIGDANSFFQDSIQLSGNIQSIDWNIPNLLNGLNGFINIHAMLQIFFGPNFFLGHALSLLGGALCLILLSKIWQLLFPEDTESLKSIFLIYTLTPSVLTNQSYILREVWQSFCILGIAWIAVEIRLKGSSILKYGQLLIFAVPGFFLHTSMSLTIPLLILSTFLTTKEAKETNYKQFFINPVWLIRSIPILLVMCIIMIPFISMNAFLSQDSGLLETAENYGANSALDSRTSYGNLFKASQPWTIIPAFLAYQLAPAPWQISNGGDFLVMLENLYRLRLLVFFWRKKANTEKKLHVPIDRLMLTWLMMEIVWSVGTINWGTASRHHVPSYGLLIICGLACKDNSITRRY